MDPKLESLNINCSADKIAEYISTSGSAPEKPVTKKQKRRFSHSGLDGSIHPVEDVDMPQNPKKGFHRKNSIGTSSSLY